MSGLALAACSSSKGPSSTVSSSTGGYGLIVGKVGPCAAKKFDASPTNPLIVVLSKNARTYDTYNVSADRGTTWFHFDVSVGRYKLTATWPRTKEYNVLVELGKTTKVNIRVSCGPAVI
jgi:hypothetical protein